MLRYETLFLTVPEITVDEASAIESKLEKLVQDAKGVFLSFDRWGKYKLAYPVRKFDYGIYFLVRFDVDQEHRNKLLEDLRTFFSVKHADLVMRHFVDRLDPHASLEYKRPESLEEVPTRDVDIFLKENKMSGLIGKSSLTNQEFDEHIDDDLEVVEH